jgi:outer membrane protein assembly factor BamB
MNQKILPFGMFAELLAAIRFAVCRGKYVNRDFQKKISFTLALLLILSLPIMVSSDEPSNLGQSNFSLLLKQGGSSVEYRPDTVIVRFKTTTDPITGKEVVDQQAIESAHAAVGATVVKSYSADFLPGLQVVSLPVGTSVETAINQYQQNPAVLYAEPDYLMSGSEETSNHSGSVKIPILSGNPTNATNQGRKFRSDLNNSGIYDDGGIRPNNIKKWDFSTGSYVDSSPAIIDGVIYVGSNDGKLYALNSDTGEKIWDFFTGGNVTSSPAVANSVVYVGSLDKKVYALNAETGSKIWDFNTGGNVTSSPAVANGVVYVGSLDKKVYALNAETGSKIWDFTTGGGVSSSPAVANGVVYVGSGDGKLYALDMIKGTKIWEFATELRGSPGASSSPSVANGVVYIEMAWCGVDMSEKTVYALNATTGMKIWNFKKEFGLFSYSHGCVPPSSPAVINDVVYVGGDKMYALNAATGIEIWHYFTEGDISSSPSMANGIVYVGSRDNRLHALNATSGAKLWDFMTGGWIESSPSVANGTVFVGSRDGHIYAIGTLISPLSAFTVNRTSGPAPLTIQFKDTSIGSGPFSYAWDFFNDGTIDSTSQNPSFTYPLSGSYTVSLTVTGPGGTDSEVKSDFITVKHSLSPIAKFTANQTSGSSPLTVQFKDISTNDPTSWNWDFGDGTWFNTTDKSERSPSHTYTMLATYPVRLTTANAYGSDTSSMTTIRVAKQGQMFRSDPQHSGSYNDGGIRPTNSKLWDNNLYSSGFFSDYDSSPAVVDGVVYIGRGMVYAFDTTTGNKLWDFATENYGMKMFSSPAAVDGVIYVGGDNVYALDAITGNKLWVFATGTMFCSNPAVVDGVVFVGSSDVFSGWGKLFALNATTGTKLWDFTTGINIFSSPAVADGVVYIANGDNKLSALNAETGSKIWDYTLGGGISSSPAVVNGIVYVGSGDNKVYALNAETGSKIWDYTTGGGVSSSPAVTNDIVYVGSLDNKVYALNAETGEKIWDFFTGGNVSSSPAVANGVVYIGSKDAKLYALSAETGAKLWDFSINEWGGISSSPAVANGVVYIGNWYKMYAIGCSGVPPNASFTANRTSGPAPLTIQFIGSSTGSEPLTYAWDFTNDGIIDSTLQNPSFTYSLQGVYTVNFTVTGPGGIDSEVKPGYITIKSPQSPAASFTATPTSGPPPLAVQFTDRSTNNPMSWNWSFGDGTWFNTTNSSQKNPTHTYTTLNVYEVMLTVSNSQGSDTSPVITITVMSQGWMFRANPQHTGIYDDGGKRPNNVLKWDFTSGGGVYSSPAVADGVVYVGSNDNKVYALNAVTGAKIWDFNTGGWNGVSSSPAVANGIVYVGSYDNKVYALNAVTGAKIWDFTTGDYVSSSPAVANGIVYVGSYDNKVYALNAVTGAKIWDFTTGDYVSSSPAVANGIVYVGSYDNKVYAFNAVTGAKIWDFTTGGGVSSSPAVADGVVYVGSDDNKVYALNAVTGAKIWDFITDGLSGVTSSPAVANGIVYVGSNGNRIYALNAMTGEKIWDFTTRGSVSSSPAVANGIVYVGSNGNRVYALNAVTGEKIWDFTTRGSVSSSPAVANGFVYVGSGDSKVYAIGGNAVPPNATFTANRTWGPAPLTVQFIGSSTGSDPLTYAWDFTNDGIIDSTLQNPSFIYNLQGTYTVNFTVTGPGGVDSDVKPGYITVKSPQSPAASFTATPISGPAPLTVQFTDHSTNNPMSWNWNFGDGTPNSTLEDPNHVYQSIGTYTVTLSVSNSYGSDTLPMTTINVANQGVMFRADPQHTGIYDDGGTRPTNTEKWRFSTDEGNSISSSPVVADGVVFIGGGSQRNAYITQQFQKVYALNAMTGAKIWNFTTGNYVYSSPAVADGVVYVGSLDSKVYALNAVTGAKIWDFTTGDYVSSSPAVADGVVYVGSYDDKVYALNAETGAQIWDFTTGSVVSSSPAVANGIVYVGSYDNNVYALNAETGAQIWEFTAGGGVYSSPAVANGVVYVGSGDRNVYALNAKTGSKIWDFTTENIVDSSPAVANGIVYVGSGGRNVYALNAVTGAKIWNFTTGGGVYSSPAVANGVVYVGSGDRNVYALNAVTGAKIWNFTTRGWVESSPAVANGIVYVGSDDGNVYAIGGGYVPPAASFTATPVSGSVPLTVKFTDRSSNNPTSWNWNFGDGSENATVEDPVHTYTKQGVFTPRLTVTNAAGISTFKGKNITVTLPNRWIEVSPESVAVNIESGTKVLRSLTVTYHDESPAPMNLNFQTSKNAKFLGVLPISGTLKSGQSTTLNVTFNASGTLSGTYYGNVTLSAITPVSISPVVIPMNMTVTTTPAMTVSLKSLTISVKVNQTKKRDFTIYSRKTGVLDYILVSERGWVTSSPIAGSIAPRESARISVTVDATNRAKGVYYKNIAISSNDPRYPAGYVIPVTVKVT